MKGEVAEQTEAERYMFLFSFFLFCLLLFLLFLLFLLLFYLPLLFRYFFFYLLLLFTFVLSQWDFPYEKFGLLSCHRVALPNLRCMLGILVFPQSTELRHGLKVLQGTHR